jgi:GNAT superfamily N-acetyltransferase
MNTTIRRYTSADADALFALLRSEGDEWSDYHAGDGVEKYRIVLNSSIVYVLFEQDELCGYARLHDDHVFGLYVYDLLVSANHRGKSHGRALLEQACIDYPDSTVYAMSDVDLYYEKQGYQRAGSIFVVTRTKAKFNISPDFKFKTTEEFLGLE